VNLTTAKEDFSDDATLRASGLPWYKFNHIHAPLVYILTRHGLSVAFNIYLRIISARLIKAYQLPLSSFSHDRLPGSARTVFTERDSQRN